MATPAIQVDGLQKSFGDFAAVKGVSFTVNEGEIFGFLGPNGAGKSTTIKMLATLLPPSGGRASIAGFDVVAQPRQVRSSIGLIFQDQSLDDRLTAYENLRIHALLYDVPGRELPARAERVLKMVDLFDRKDGVVRTFSGGMKRRLEIARGLLHQPKVLFLDEPTVGLDPQTRNAIWSHVRGLRDQGGVTVFMTTHYMDEAENCDRIAVIDHGQIVALGTPAELKKQVGGEVVMVEAAPELAAKLSEKYGVQVKSVGDRLHFEVADGAAFMPRIAADFAGQIRSLSVHVPTLDDVFLKLTGREIRAEEAGARDQLRQMARAWRRR